MLCFRSGDPFYADGTHLNPAAMALFCNAIKPYTEAGRLASFILVKPSRLPFLLFLLTCSAVAVFYHVLGGHGCCRLGQLPLCRRRHIRGCYLHRPFGLLGTHGTFCLREGNHLRDYDGTLAEALLPTPVRPAWGQGFRWGRFSQHLWQHLPRGATKALLVCAGSCSALILAFFLFLSSLLCLLPGNDLLGDPQDVAWHMQKMQEAR